MTYGIFLNRCCPLRPRSDASGERPPKTFPPGAPSMAFFGSGLSPELWKPFTTVFGPLRARRKTTGVGPPLPSWTARPSVQPTRPRRSDTTRPRSPRAASAAGSSLGPLQLVEEGAGGCRLQRTGLCPACPLPPAKSRGRGSGEGSKVQGVLCAGPALGRHGFEGRWFCS